MATTSQQIATLLKRPAEEVAALDALEGADAEQLISDIEHARAKQSEHLKNALEDAVSHVPRLLRGPMRKMLGV